MSIPHVDRSIAHVGRAVIPAPPHVVFERLFDLADVIADRRDVRVESWPDGGLRTAGASFWAVHQAVPAAGHAVAYRVTALEAPNLLDLHASCDLYEANHRVVVAPATGDGTEVSWTVAFAPEQPTTSQLLQDAALLATVTLQEIDTGPAAPGGVIDIRSMPQDAAMAGDAPV